MTAPFAEARLRLRIVLSENHRIGPGKIDLLEAISRTGSIAAAGRELGMSYRRAWLLIDALNSLFTEPVVTTATGGAQGGGASLTPLGQDLIRAFRSLENRTCIAMIEEFGAFSERIRTE